MDEISLKIFSPLYLVGKEIPCWKCGGTMPVIALIATRVEEMDDEICILSDIEELPQDILHHMAKRSPSFKLQYSQTLGESYYGNTCPHCSMLTGDHYLHATPGGAFFPVNEEEARRLYITEIPIKAPVFIEAAYRIGVGDLILECAQKIS